MMKATQCHVIWACMQSQILCIIDSLVLGRQKNTLLINGYMCNARPPIIHLDNLVSNRPHENGFFAIVCQVSNLGPIKIVVPHEVALPFVCHPNHDRNPIVNQVSTNVVV